MGWQHERYTDSERKEQLYTLTEQASTVGLFLGSRTELGRAARMNEQVYEEDGLTVKTLGGSHAEVYADGELVFETSTHPGMDPFVGTYEPGDWEDRLDDLYQQARNTE